MKLRYSNAMALVLLAVSVGVDAKDAAAQLDDLDFAQAEFVQASQSTDGSWCFSVTVRHNDQGWDHYANGWQILDTDGVELGYRLLAHPHDHEQPFTRRLCGVSVPSSVSEVLVRAKCEQHGYGGRAITVDLSLDEGDGFAVKRAQ